MIRLGELVAAIPDARLIAGALDLPILGITHDSRAVTPGCAFVALPGRQHDGSAFVLDAHRHGAVAVLSERAVPTADLAWVAVPAARPALADAAAVYHGYPSQRLRVIGVTGTDGKTTTTRLIAGVLEAAGLAAGWFTTADVKVGERLRPNRDVRTTPEADRLQGVLAEIVDAGARYAVIESSSHALAQERLRACAFDVGVFTNLSPEHLDYHGSLDAYLDAKARLFAALNAPSEKTGPRYAVLNADDPASARLRAVTAVPTFTYALEAVADVRGTSVEHRPEGVSLTIEHGGDAWRLETRFLGAHNAANWLAAVTVALQEGVPIPRIQSAARVLSPAAGRLQRVDRGQPFGVWVDFAHTPQALSATIAALRASGAKRVLLGFGMAGGRMAANRPVMGELAAALADYFVITSDDAYPEDPAAIAAAIEAGARARGAQPEQQYAVELDRREAIRQLLARAQPGDAVLLAGMGHETSLHVRAVAEAWDEPAIAAQLLETLGYGAQVPRPDGPG